MRARARLLRQRGGGARDIRVHGALLQQDRDSLGAGLARPRGVREKAEGREPLEGGLAPVNEIGADSPSYLTISAEEADELVRKHSGTGEPALDGNGLWNGREKCTSSGIIGVVVTKGGKHIPTNGFTIHYSKKGAHIVPRR